MVDALGPARLSGARQALDDIADDLWENLAEDDGAPSAALLADATLFFGAMAKALPDAGHEAKAMHLMDRAMDALARSRLPSWLHGGYVGVAFALECVASDVFGRPRGSVSEDVRDALEGALRARPWSGNFDLVSGLAGYAVYCATLGEAGRATLALVTEHLRRTSVEDGEGRWWLTRVGWVPPRTAALFPRGYYDLGVAHGLAGTLVALASATGDHVGGESARTLLEGCVSKLLASRETSARQHSTFARWIAADGERAPSRLAWCQGDPGIAAALLATARHRADDALADVAHEIALACASQGPAAFDVRDASLCHGSMGLAHCFDRMNRDRPDERYRRARDFWFDDALRRHDGGFLFCVPRDDGGPPDYVVRRSLLEGTAGIGLALLSLTSERPTLPWDAALGIAIPNGGVG
jgi:hypothetical protein